MPAAASDARGALRRVRLRAKRQRRWPGARRLLPQPRGRALPPLLCAKACRLVHGSAPPLCRWQMCEVGTSSA
eukprot:892565-Pleurochrysis_carterae.AAC.2